MIKRISHMRISTALAAARHHARSCPSHDCHAVHRERSAFWWYRMLRQDPRTSMAELSRRQQRRASRESALQMARAAAQNHRDTCGMADCSLDHREAETMWWYRRLRAGHTAPPARP